jgi:hypothetical protein
MTNYNPDSYPYKWYVCPICDEAFCSNAAHVIYCSPECGHIATNRRWYAKNREAWNAKRRNLLATDTERRELNKARCKARRDNAKSR